MKENSQKILLLLFPASPQAFSLSYNWVEVLLPELTSGGRRSLLHHLEKQGYIIREKVMGQQTISITPLGTRECKRLFPPLSSKFDSWEGEWELMVFLEASQSDPQFRYLRNLILEERSLTISRGVYAAPKSFSHKVMGAVDELYRSNVAVFKLAEWKLGSQKQLIIDQLALVDVVEGYSGISREITELLGKCKNNVRLTDQQKLQILPVFNRFWENLKADPGFSRFYYPNAPKASDLLNELQNLINCLSDQQS